MRVHQRALLLTIAACAAIGVAGRPATAQSTNDPQKSDHAAIRLGVYFPTNTKIRREVGNTIPGGGVDFTIQQNGPNARTIVSIDFIDRNDHDRQVQLLPVTIGQQWYQTDKSQRRSDLYFGYGIGAYFADVNVVDDNGSVSSKNGTLVGGYFNAGLDVYQGIFIDARYHITNTTGAANPGGLELTAGYRF